MKEHLLSLDQQIAEGLEIGRAFSVSSFDARRISKILFCGLGGSAISGDILRVLSARACPHPFAVERSGEIPRWTDPKTLVILSTYSGNTDEILTCFRKALRAKAQILIVTSGGRVARLAVENKLPYLLIPAGLAPRNAVGYLTFSVLPVLKKLCLLDFSESEIQEVLSVVRAVSEKKVKAAARELTGRCVHLYGGSGFMEPVVLRWRAQFAENAKTLASHLLLPEMFHNEIEAWQFPKKVVRASLALFLKDRDDPLGMKHKRAFVIKALARRHVKAVQIQSQGKSPLARIFSLIAFGDRTSCELARLNGVDPLPVPILEALKKIK